MQNWRQGIVWVLPTALIGAVAITLAIISAEGDSTAEGSVDDPTLPETEDPPSDPPSAAARPAARMRAPTSPLPTPPVVTRDPSFKTQAYARGFRFRSEIYSGPASNPKVIGYSRRGTVLPAGSRIYGKGCKGGSWYKVAGGGAVCTKQGFVVASKPEDTLVPPNIRQLSPSLDRALPYAYAKVDRKRQPSPRLYRVPKANEVKLLQVAAKTGKDWPEVVDKPMQGAFFIATDRVEGTDYMRTIRGRYVLKDHLLPIKCPPMRGELLQPKGMRLPLVFVYDKQRTLYRLQDGKLVRAGTAEKHARARLRRVLKRGGKTYVQLDSGLLLQRSGVRVVRAIKRPDRIPAGVKWVHVDLAQQALVAYEDSKPVFATLVSSGKEGFTPPLGVFRVASKHLSITMNGPDPDVDWYEVEEVPWTMFYWESYALHGAYWHNDFGKPRSHGCTNLAPQDARWLFQWSTPRLEQGWHGRVATGTYVTFTS